MVEDPSTAAQSPLLEDLSYLSEVNGFRIVSLLQAGGQASVYLAQRVGVPFALKAYHQRPTSISEFKNQISILADLEFRGILPVAETIQDVLFCHDAQDPKPTNMIATPFFANGDLLEYIRSHGSLSENCCCFFAKKLLSTFLYLKSRNILHGDIKAENIILDDGFKPLLIDFGFAMRGNEKGCKLVGDWRYTSPQAVRRKDYTFKSQVYSLGILLFYAMTGCFPFAVARVADTNYRLLLQAKKEVFWSKVEQRTGVKFQSEFKEVFLWMTCSNPKDRCSLQQVIELSWFLGREMSEQQYSLAMQQSRKVKPPLQQIFFN